jgi:hypothetical protein
MLGRQVNRDDRLLYLLFAIYKPLRARYMTQPRLKPVRLLATRDGKNFRVKTGQRQAQEREPRKKLKIW